MTGDLRKAMDQAQASRDGTGPYRPMHEALSDEILSLRKRIHDTHTRGSGRPSYLDAVQYAFLVTAIKDSYPKAHGIDRGAWTGNAVREYIQKEFSETITVRHAQRLLRTIRGTNA